MTPRRIAVTIAAAALAVGGASGAAFAHGGPGGPGGPGGFGGPGSGPGAALQCEVPEAQLLTADTSRALKRLRARLDRRVSAGRITQAQADARFQREQVRLSVQKLVTTARQQPVLDLLGITSADLAAAREEGLSLIDIADEKGVGIDDLLTALRTGRDAAEAKFDELCQPVDEEDTTTTTTTAPAV
ncbi:MAG: hypothetical protein U0237_17590 [Thermoleophilia bacterium]